MKTVAIVPAAGSGKRLGSKISKPFVRLGGKPLVIYALKALDSSACIDSIAIAAERRWIGRMERLVKKFKLKKVTGVYAGGATRSGSVANCLAGIGPDFDTVLIHDAARPFLDDRVIRDSVMLARRFGACITAVPENDTVKLADTAGLFVRKTLDRRRIFRAQTPQAFRREVIDDAYKAGGVSGLTDDSAAAEERGVRVRILLGSGRNIKITTREDLKLAELLLRKR